MNPAQGARRSKLHDTALKARNEIPASQRAHSQGKQASSGFALGRMDSVRGLRCGPVRRSERHARGTSKGTRGSIRPSIRERDERNGRPLAQMERSSRVPYEGRARGTNPSGPRPSDRRGV
jgi:hypothetical protein